MTPHSVLPRGIGKIAIYSVPKQTWVTVAITDNESNRKKLQKKADELNNK